MKRDIWFCKFIWFPILIKLRLLLFSISFRFRWISETLWFCDLCFFHRNANIVCQRDFVVHLLKFWRGWMSFRRFELRGSDVFCWDIWFAWLLCLNFSLFALINYSVYFDFHVISFELWHANWFFLQLCK